MTITSSSRSMVSMIHLLAHGSVAPYLTQLILSADVNLLDGLDPSLGLHLPASRLPTPPSAPNSARHQRRASSGSHARRPSTTSLSSAPCISPAPHPVIRRSFRRVLSLRSALHVRMRTVACPVSGLGVGTRLMAGMGMDKSDEEGMVMCVEVAGLGDGKGGGFEVEGVEVEVTGGGVGRGDVEVKAVEGEREQGAMPLLLEAGDQHNFLYAITVAVDPSSEAEPGGLADELGVASGVRAPVGVGASVPIHVATSPSQRFAARFGAEPDRQHERLEHELPQLPPPDRTWLRNVAITVRGRPTSGARRGEGYAVPGSVSLTGARVWSSEVTWPTESFASRWNCTLDVAPFATRQAQQSTAFAVPELAAPAAPALALALARRRPSALEGRPPSRPLPPTPSLRTAIAPENVESVAGSHRHTVASLHSLASRSPYLSRPARPDGLDLADGAGLDRHAAQAQAQAHLTAQTPGATGPSRRFLSMPLPASTTPGVGVGIGGGDVVGTPLGYGAGVGGFDWGRRSLSAATPVGTPGVGAGVQGGVAHRLGGGAEVVNARETGLRQGGARGATDWEEDGKERSAPESM